MVRRLLGLSALLFTITGVVSAAAAAPSIRRSRVADVDLSRPAPADLNEPEGRSRWDLEGLALSGRRLVTISAERSAVRLEGAPVGPGGSGSSRVYSDAGGRHEASHWLFPDGDPDMMRPGSRTTIEIDESVVVLDSASSGAPRARAEPVSRGEAGSGRLAPGGLDEPAAAIPSGSVDSGPWSAGRLRIEIEVVGLGWVHLPSGPREAVLQRALVLREAPGRRGFVPESLVHRWVDPRAGVVAEVSGPASSDGRRRDRIDRAWVLEETFLGAADLKIHVGELIPPAHFNSVLYGWDRGPGTLVSSLTPEAYANIGQLIAANAWNFSAITASSFTPISGTTTANNAMTVTGSGTSFSSQLAAGDRISLSSAPASFATITAIASNTSLTVASPLGNGTSQTINRRVREAASTTTPVTAAETCNTLSCGYAPPTPPGTSPAQLDRRDKLFGTPGLVKSNAVHQRQDRASDTVLWLRAGAQKEGRSGGFGDGETRFCYITDDNGDGTVLTRTEVPEWIFSHPDGASGLYFQAGDSWAGGPFNCEQNLFNEVCRGGGAVSKLYTKACGTHTGKHYIDIVKGGVLTLPSGHTFNALLVRNVADFCVYIAAGCASIFKVDEARTVNYLWQVPHLGTVARLQSAQNVPDVTSFSTLEETDIEFGLYPPRSIQATASTDTTVSLSWDPGLDTHRINGYRIYWDIDSGASGPYAFNSVANAGQVAFAGTTATISGLTAGTTYHFTVTSLSTFTDPSTSVATNYESLRYPSTVSGDPSFVYPVEVQRATTGGACVPTALVAGVTVTKSPSDITVCWNPASDPCLIGYRVLGSTTPTSDAGFTTVADTGLTTCWTGATPKGYFLVVARGAGGTGPWGAYGH